MCNQYNKNRSRTSGYFYFGTPSKNRFAHGPRLSVQAPARFGPVRTWALPNKFSSTCKPFCKPRWVHRMVPRARFELATPALGRRRSNPLSYRGSLSWNRGNYTIYWVGTVGMLRASTTWMPATTTRSPTKDDALRCSKGPKKSGILAMLTRLFTTNGVSDRSKIRSP